MIHERNFLFSGQVRIPGAIIVRGCVNHILHVAFFGKNDCVTNFSQQFPSSEISPQSRKIIPQANFYHFKLIICRNEWLKAVCFLLINLSVTDDVCLLK